MAGAVPVRLRTAATIVCMALGALTRISGQSNTWPEYLMVPQSPDTVVDSSTIKIKTEQLKFGNYYNSLNVVNWRRNNAAMRFRQDARYLASGDNQTGDLSGGLNSDSILPYGGGAGLEWKPVTTLYLSERTRSFQTTADVGPFLHWRIRDFPVKVHGGVSGESWSDTLLSPLYSSRLDDIHSDVGYYGGLSAGEYGSKTFGIPLYLTAKAFGRSVQNVGNAMILGSALYAQDLGQGDSLFAYFGDSLSDGKERPGLLQNYTNTPWRISHSFQAASGIKMKGRYGLKPSMLYSYFQNAVSYPTQPHYLSDVRTSGNSLNFLIASGDEVHFGYQGGIKIGWGDVEWLFGKDLSETALLFSPNKMQRDSLNVKLDDHTFYTAASDHFAWIRIVPWLRSDYKLSAFRNSRTYEFAYHEGGIEKKKNNDDDRISLLHHLGFVVDSIPNASIEVFGEYSTYLENYLKREYSAQNKTLNGYRLGCVVAYAPSERFRLDERLIADVSSMEYQYTERHREPFDPPPYARTLFSVCTGSWNVTGPWFLVGRWEERHSDNGQWYGSDYRPDSLKSGYYAIQEKSIDYLFQGAVAFENGWSRIEAGSQFRNIFNKKYVYDNILKAGRYVLDPNRTQYFEPFIEAKISMRRVRFAARIMQIVDTDDWRPSATWSPKRNWDIHLKGTFVW